jgi:hypothetical protein
MHTEVLCVCVMLVVLLASGCVTSTGKNKYPQSWSTLEKDAASDGCPKLSGVYENRASATFPSGRHDSTESQRYFSR